MTIFFLLSQFIATALAGVLDRIRGDTWHLPGGRVVDKIIYGYALAVVAGFPIDPLITPAIVALMAIGMSYGWGEPLGAILDNRLMVPNSLEWWQKGPLKTNPILALIVRGAMWGIPISLLGFLHPSLFWFAPAYTVAFPVAAIAARKFFKGNWEVSEYIRGWLAALIVLAGSFIS